MDRDIKAKQSQIIKHYGTDNQLRQLTEECGELIVAIAKFQRSGQSLNIRSKTPSMELADVIFEIADVENLIEQIKCDYGLININVDIVKKQKVNRELMRIYKED